MEKYSSDVEMRKLQWNLKIDKEVSRSWDVLDNGHFQILYVKKEIITTYITLGKILGSGGKDTNIK